SKPSLLRKRQLSDKNKEISDAIKNRDTIRIRSIRISDEPSVKKADCG
ncbi:7072_t:CDS:1, partial [Funneliformis geosporum]